MKKTLLAIVAVAIASASFAQGIEVTETQNTLLGNSYFGGNITIEKGYTLKIGEETIDQLIMKKIGTGSAPNLSGDVTIGGNLSVQGKINSGNSISAQLLSGNTVKATEKMIIGSPTSIPSKLNVGGDGYITGNVGIGTTPNSNYKLSVGGNSNLQGTVKTDKIIIGNPQTTTSLLYIGGDCEASGTIKTIGKVSAGSVNTQAVSAQTISTQTVSAQTVTSDQTVSAKYLKYSISCTKSSDKRFKKNIKNLPNETISKLKQIESKTYQYKSQSELMSLYQSVNGDTAQVKYYDTDRNQYGFLAQDFEKVFPELVYTDSLGLKSIDYISLIPILLQAIQEQQTQIEYLLANAEIKTNNGNHNGQNNGNGNGNGKNNGNNGNGNGNNNKRNGGNNVSNANAASNSAPVAFKVAKPAELEQTETENALFQNTPNPFSQETQIEYTLANDAQNAMICIYNMNGEQLRCFPLNIESSGVITIEGNDLVAGMYLYSLLVDDQLIDTKRMVLTF